MVITQQGYTIELTDASVLTDAFIAQWRDLEDESIDPNPYLSPQFQLPAFDYLCETKPWFLCVWKRHENKQQLVGMIVVNKVSRNRVFPFARLSVFRSMHSFLAGMLIHSAFAVDVSDQIAKYFADPKTRFAGLCFSGLSADEKVISLLKVAAEKNGGECLEDSRVERACLCGGGSAATEPQYYRISAKKKKDIRRRMRRLEELGSVDWRYLEGEGVTDESIEKFLILEHMGWKADTKTSILSSENEAKFFREMIKNFRSSEGLFFCELLLNGEVISSTCNLKNVNKGYAYKVSWNPEYRKYSPGILNEVEFLKAMDAGLVKMTYVDSGASADSYINDLWIDRSTLVTGCIVFKRKYVLVAKAVDGLKRFKRTVMSIIKKSN